MPRMADAALRQHEEVAQLHARFEARREALWRSFLQARSPAPPRGPADTRFASKLWRDIPYFDYLSQNYLLASQWIMELVETLNLAPKQKEQLRFVARQWTEALCPANFAATNQEVIARAIETRGESFTHGQSNFQHDWERARLRMCDESAF
ncbi:MAG: hypothetical protein EXR36_11085 [Betaproteobacteria bacterium]|nr:hypothetical protein [Betaproteobacteria bacterium]